MTLKIKNRLPLAETVLLSFVFLGGIVSATYQSIIISQLSINPYVTPYFWVSVIFSVAALLFVLNRRKKSMGFLTIDLENKSFSLNHSPMLTFDKLTEYNSRLANSSKSRISGMSIILGTKENGSFTIIDADRFYFMPKGRSNEELEALNSLVEGSSLTSEQKASYENWHGRASLVNL